MIPETTPPDIFIKIPEFPPYREFKFIYFSVHVNLQHVQHLLAKVHSLIKTCAKTLPFLDLNLCSLTNQWHWVYLASALENSDLPLLYPQYNRPPSPHLPVISVLAWKEHWYLTISHTDLFISLTLLSSVDTVLPTWSYEAQTRQHVE